MLLTALSLCVFLFHIYFLLSPASLCLPLFASVAAGVEEVCCICDAPPLKEPLINCLKCRHGKEARLIVRCQAVGFHRFLH